MKIIFVCRGNVGRSQIAEGLFKKLVGNRHEVTSAGTKISGPEQPIGELGGVENVIEVMKEEGIDVSKNIRRQLTKEMVESSDIVILLVDDNDPLPDYVLNNIKVTKWHVNDPKGQTLEFTRHIREQINRLVTDFAKVETESIDV